MEDGTEPRAGEGKKPDVRRDCGCDGRAVGQCAPECIEQ